MPGKSWEVRWGGGEGGCGGEKGIENEKPCFFLKCFEKQNLYFVKSR